MLTASLLVSSPSLSPESYPWVPLLTVSPPCPALAWTSSGWAPHLLPTTSLCAGPSACSLCTHQAATWHPALCTAPPPSPSAGFLPARLNPQSAPQHPTHIPVRTVSISLQPGWDMHLPLRNTGSCAHTGGRSPWYWEPSEPLSPCCLSPLTLTAHLWVLTPPVSALKPRPPVRSLFLEAQSYSYTHPG